MNLPVLIPWVLVAKKKTFLFKNQHATLPQFPPQKAHSPPAQPRTQKFTWLGKTEFKTYPIERPGRPQLGGRAQDKASTGGWIHDHG